MLSRRAWIARLSPLAGLALLTQRCVTATATQATKAAAHYQDYPSAGQMCGMCKFFIPPAASRDRA